MAFVNSRGAQAEAERQWSVCCAPSPAHQLQSAGAPGPLRPSASADANSASRRTGGGQGYSDSGYHHFGLLRSRRCAFSRSIARRSRRCGRRGTTSVTSVGRPRHAPRRSGRDADAGWVNISSRKTLHSATTAATYYTTGSLDALVPHSITHSFTSSHTRPRCFRLNVGGYAWNVL